MASGEPKSFNFDGSFGEPSSAPDFVDHSSELTRVLPGRSQNAEPPESEAPTRLVGPADEYPGSPSATKKPSASAQSGGSFTNMFGSALVASSANFEGSPAQAAPVLPGGIPRTEEINPPVSASAAGPKVKRESGEFTREFLAISGGVPQSSSARAASVPPASAPIREVAAQPAPAKAQTGEFMQRFNAGSSAEGTGAKSAFMPVPGQSAPSSPPPDIAQPGAFTRMFSGTPGEIPRGSDFPQLAGPPAPATTAWEQAQPSQQRSLSQIFGQHSAPSPLPGPAPAESAPSLSQMFSGGTKAAAQGAQPAAVPANSEPQGQFTTFFGNDAAAAAAPAPVIREEKTTPGSFSAMFNTGASSAPPEAGTHDVAHPVVAESKQERPQPARAVPFSAPVNPSATNVFRGPVESPANMGAAAPRGPSEYTKVVSASEVRKLQEQQFAQQGSGAAPALGQGAGAAPQIPGAPGMQPMPAAPPLAVLNPGAMPQLQIPNPYAPAPMPSAGAPYGMPQMQPMQPAPYPYPQMPQANLAPHPAALPNLQQMPNPQVQALSQRFAQAQQTQGTKPSVSWAPIIIALLGLTVIAMGTILFFALAGK